MPLYTMSQASIIERARSLRKTRIWVSCAVTAFFILAFYIRSYGNPGPGHPHFDFVEGVSIALFVMLMQLIQPYPWRRSSLDIAEKAAVAVEIGSDVIDVSIGLYHRRIAISDIVKAEEPSWGSGLYPRTSKRYSWVVIPRRVDGYDEIKKYLTLMVIPIVKTKVPGNWEEILLAILFCSSLICDVATSSPMVLSVNLGVGLLIALAGIFFARTNLDRRLRLMSLAGLFIPAIAALVALLLVTGCF
jgi:hypothetical protein